MLQNHENIDKIMTNHEFLYISCEILTAISTMNVSDVVQCGFTHWYGTFHDITPKSVILPLPDDFKQYLLSDGLVLPKSSGTQTAQDRNDDVKDDNSDEWSDEDGDDTEAPEFEAFETEITQAIDTLGGAVFPKLNWSSPQDASWVTFDNSLRCTTPADVYLLLKSSDFVTRDLTQPFVHCQDYKNNSETKGDNSHNTEDNPDTKLDEFANIQYSLILRKWVDIQTGLEFRCVVKSDSLIAISQRHYSKYYEFIPAMTQEIVRQLTQFFSTHISKKFPLSNYVFDVYRDRHKRWRLLDFNPFGPITDLPLFSWTELMDLKEIPAVPEFRYIESEGLIRPSPFSGNALPKDVTDLCTGEDASKMVDFLQLQSKISTQNRTESSSDEDDINDMISQDR